MEICGSRAGTREGPHPAPLFQHPSMTTSIRILYNLERKSHFHRPYYYGSNEVLVSYNPRGFAKGDRTLREEA